MKKNILPLIIILLPIAFVVVFLWFLYGGHNQELPGDLTASLLQKKVVSLKVDLGQDNIDTKKVMESSEITISDPEGEIQEDIFDIDLVNAESGGYELKINPKKPTLRPGRYYVSAKFVTEQGVKDYSQDFYWGVLALNFDKSVYLPGETAYFQMAVLNDLGDTLCGVDLELKITDPQGRENILTTADNTIVKNPKCGPNNVIDEPDYYARHLLYYEGVYKFKLIAQTRDGVRSIEDFVEVKRDIPFEVQRKGPTRIFPVANYEMQFNVKANQDFKGEIIERVPSSFAITPSADFSVREDNDTKEIAWDLNLRKGETYNLKYTFDAPDISPEFYLLGPLSINSWQEERFWQIASDTTETLAPDAYVTQTNLDGTISDIDEDPDSPDSNWADAVSDSSDVLAHVSFPSPSNNLTTGAGLQNFKIYARRSTSAATPTIYAHLYESGVYKANTSLTATNVTSDSGQLFTGTWDASSLSNINGSGVEAYVYGTKATASPSFTARTEQYARGSSLSSPYDFTVNKATGTVDGDIMFMFLAIYVATPPTIDSVPAGWTQIATNTTTNSRWYLYYKVASSEGANYTWSLTGSCRYYALNISYSSGAFDVQSISDITAISNTLYGTAGTTVRAASMNVPSANSPLLYFGAIYNTTVRTFTPPTAPVDSWSEDADEGHTTPDLSLTIGSQIWTGSGNTGDMDITCSTSITTYKHAFAISLKPAATNSSVDIGAVEWNVDYTIPNNTPTISEVKDGPDPSQVGHTVTFAADWADQDAEGVNLFVCTSSGGTSSGCPSTTYCSTAGYGTSDPMTCPYNTTSAGTNTYYAYVCDNEPSCSSELLGTFTVNTVNPTSFRIDGRFIFDSEIFIK